MKKLLKFTEPKDQLSCFSHSVQLEAHEQFTVEDTAGTTWVVVGYRKRAARSNRTGCIFGCEPSALVVSKQLKAGGPGKTKLIWGRSDMPQASWQKFESLFPLMASYSRHQQHLMECAQDLVQEYERHPPDAANWYIQRNPYWSQILDQYLIRRENRRFDAGLRIKQAQSEWFADEDLSGVFTALMSRTPAPELASVEARIEEARKLKFDYERLQKTIFTAHKFEDMRSEYQEALNMKKKLDAMVRDLAPHLPKVFGVIPVLDRLPSI